MLVIKPSAELITADNPYKLVELAGRICYKSEDKITDDSCVDFVKKMVGRNHYAMLEHGIIHLKVRSDIADVLDDLSIETQLFRYLPYFRLDEKGDGYLTGSFRALKEFIETIRQDYLDERQTEFKYAEAYLCGKYPEVFGKASTASASSDFVKELSDEDFIKCIKEVFKGVADSQDTFNRLVNSVVSNHIFHTVKFVCDRGVSHELVRHRPCSFAQESTRYCNYAKDKFGEEITVIEPFYFEGDDKVALNLAWVNAMQSAEKEYLYLIKTGATPQEAIAVLPNSLKTEIVVTASETEWQHIVDLRYKGVTGAPHPQMKEVMTIIAPELSKVSDGRINCDVAD